ncbi:hypothetical protein QBC37DRAFT_377548 [Rhypophila decipiens]|uniref:Uncharacterized protein n=1 Tax=Rhypophila decipiens TaxID=261697 RepID=A0AAN6Y254_9PEZI|nr:hypothetical protein QBC37DRAFT_377548 [Rhypophila decipiens]
MLHKYILTVFLATMATAAPSNPNENPVEDAVLDKRCTNWKAKGGDCDKDWGGNCYNACVREGLDKGCKKGDISSDIVRGCWNPLQSKCSCHCC